VGSMLVSCWLIMPYATEHGYGLATFSVVFGTLLAGMLAIWIATAVRTYTYNYLRRVNHISHSVRFTRPLLPDSNWKTRSFNNSLMIVLLFLETLAHTSVYINFSDESWTADLIFNSFNMRF
jgi:hypothetical protein